MYKYIWISNLAFRIFQYTKLLSPNISESEFNIYSLALHNPSHNFRLVN